MAELPIHTEGFVSLSDRNVEADYDLQQQLGEGTSSVVFKGRNKITNQLFAVKVIPKVRVRNLQQMEAEVELMKKTDHPHIARLYSVYTNTQTLSLVLELCEGGDLFDHVIKKDSITEAEASIMFAQVLRAISHLHSRRICHRDIKPENFLFAQKGNVNSLKLIDFGFSKLVGRSREIMRTRTGSPYFIAPEVLKGSYGIECDMWSAGVILYVILSGVPPFSGNTESQVAAKVRKGQYSYTGAEWRSVSALAKELIDRLLLINPAERLTAEQALAHPWLSAATPQVPLEINVRQLTQFQSAAHLRKAVLFCIARQCSDHDIENLKCTFERLDTNGDGVLSFEEFRNGLRLSMTSDSLTDLWHSMDLDQNGGIDYTEFLAASLDQSLYTQQQKLWEAFVAFDRDSSGKISAFELRQVLGEGNSPQERSYWESLIREADKNGDGEIDFSEFMQLMVDRRVTEANSRLRPSNPSP